MNRILTLLLLCFSVQLFAVSEYDRDKASEISLTERNNSSHLNVYISSLPYGYIMRLINGTLVRLDDSAQGWEYHIAYKYKKIDDLTYDFWLRHDVKFQDGTPLDADSVVYNFEQFLKGAFTFTDIHNKLKSVEKIDTYHIRIHLNEPYGLLMNDLTRINFYTKDYYKKYAWDKSITGQNTSGPGPYGAGPYIMVEGHASGLSQSDKVELIANPFYFEKGMPYIQHITIYTRKPINEVVDELANEEGTIDIAFIPFNKKTEIVNSKYAKLLITPSEATLSFNINLMNPTTPLHDIRMRQALNQALNQANLIKFAYKNEGVISPFPVSANTSSVKELSTEYRKHPPLKFSDQELKSILDGLTLKVVIQDRLLPIGKGVEYQLKTYGVKFVYDVSSDEKYIFKKLLTNRAEHYDWDLLLWGNEDWARHPWSSMFALYTPNQWCSIDKDDVLDNYIRTMFTIDKTDARFTSIIETILKHIYEKAYMLSLPSPNTLIGLNKEVDFTPTTGYVLRLWEAKVTPYHWSVRGSKSLPKERLNYQLPKRLQPNE